MFQRYKSKNYNYFYLNIGFVNYENRVKSILQIIFYYKYIKDMIIRYICILNGAMRSTSLFEKTNN